MFLVLLWREGRLSSFFANLTEVPALWQAEPAGKKIDISGETAHFGKRCTHLRPSGHTLSLR
jgi:hypothetical protein